MYGRYSGVLMADTTISTNMFLPIPVVGVDPGPQYATDVNSCLTLIDQHDHSSGYGLQINPSGIDINADLPINSNNLTLVRTLRFISQSSTPALPSDLGSLYEGGVDLFYIDGVGNNIRLTQSGGISGTPGSIANLVSPASASYLVGSQKFVWQQDTNKAASMDFASMILRNTTTSSHGLTISPPAAMAADISMVLPTIPSATGIITMDTSGNMSTATPVTYLVKAAALPSYSLGMLRGVTNGVGSFEGEGMSITRTGPGAYTIAFDTPFATSPAVVLTTVGNLTIGYSTFALPATTGTTVVITAINGSLVDAPFSVIAMGKM